MLCQNCRKNEANVRYTQIINGVKKEVRLCEKCAMELGVGSFEFNMPINFANFLGDFLSDYETEMLPSFSKEDVKTCKGCGTNYDEFIKTGLFGCPECYDVFADRIDPILKKLQGSTRYNGRKLKNNNKTIYESEINKTQTKEKKEDENLNKINKLNNDLKLAIKEERYEDAAKIRDELKKIQKDK